MTEPQIRKYNPYDYFLTETKLDNEWALRSILAYSQAKQIADTLHRIQKKSLKDSDFRVREVILTGSYPEELEHPSLFQFAHNHYKIQRSIDNNMKYGAITQECIRKKYFYWKKNQKILADTKEKQDSRTEIMRAVWTHKGPPLIFFSLAGLGVVGALKLNKNTLLQRTITMMIALFFGNLYGEFKYSNQIFNSIPPLPDKQLEQERLDVYNYCFSVDVNQISSAQG